MSKKLPRLIFHASILSLLWSGMLLSCAEVNGQDLAYVNTSHMRKNTRAEKPVALKEFLSALERKYGVHFAFSSNRVKMDQYRLYYQPVEDGDLEEILEVVLSKLDLSFEKIDDRYYVISLREKMRSGTGNTLRHSVGNDWYSLALPANLGYATPKTNFRNLFQGIQPITVTGKVTSAEDGEALPGVNVIVKGTSTGAVTDMEGKYRITAPNDNDILVFSFIGFTKQEIAINGRTSINVALEVDVQSLSEVIVVGYGAVKKSDLTGSVSSVKMEDLKGIPLTSIDQGLGGRASGVMVTQTSGMPGAVASIRIRGSSSLQGGNEPLYVIDGFPVYSGDGFGNTGGNARMSGLSTVNPSDIESIEILKDASATAIYGARAANGVVLITTKTGKKGRDNISFESYYGVQKVVNTIELMDAQQYAALVNEAYTNDGMPAIYSQDDLAAISKLGKGTDWQDELFRVAPQQNYQLSFSGGDDKTVYALSGNFFKQDGIVLNSAFKRYSYRLNLERNY
jgi:TonB-dependent SusC/RagA subfamily outer membrane receptor